MANAMFAETLGNFEHLTRFNIESRCYTISFVNYTLVFVSHEEDHGSEVLAGLSPIHRRQEKTKATIPESASRNLSILCLR